MKLYAMLDCSRNAVFNLPTLKKFVDDILKMGYKGLYFYVEDVYEIEGEPYFGRFRGRYTQKELKELDDYCYEKGVELIPCIQALAHLSSIFRWKKYQHINDTNDILMCGDEKTYELIDKMFKTVKQTFRSKKVHIGFDEAHNIGRGKYLDKNGYHNLHDIFLKHLDRVNEMALSYGFEVEMWSDMMFRFANNGAYSYKGADEKLLDEICQKLPQNIKQVFWAYYDFGDEYYDQMFKLHKKYANKTSFAGGALSWFGFAPMNKIAFEIADEAIKGLKNNEIDEVMVTVWFDTGAQSSIYAYYPILLYYAERLLNDASMDEIKAKYESLFNFKFDDMMLLDLPNDVGNIDKKFHTNPSFFMLYNDYFSGSFDYTVTKDGTKLLNESKKKLEKFNNHKELGYVFELESLLCEIMSIKYDLGVRTRKAYQANDKTTLKSLVDNDYTKLVTLISKFSELFSKFWIKEHKTPGLEIENIHLGGLLERTKTCIALLNEHLKNNVVISELLEDNLSFYCDEVPYNEPVCSAQYDLSASVNPLTH